jgi:hypothetical protein
MHTTTRGTAWTIFVIRGLADVLEAVERCALPPETNTEPDSDGVIGGDAPCH